jgi:hypothetical protein
MMSRLSSAVLYAIFGLSVLFVTPAWANHIDSADATMTCSTFSLTVSASALTPGTNYEIDFTIGISPGASGFPITGSIPFTATSSTFSDTVTGSFPTLAGTFTFSGTASLVNENTIDISFSPSTLTCAPPSPVSPGDTATIGFWHNQNGQKVINSFNGGSTATMLGNWLATNFPNLFGVINPYTGTSLAGLTNAQVATVYSNLWTPSGVTKNTYVQAFAVALGCYATDASLGFNSTAASFGFKSSPGGTCAKTFNVGSNGAAFGVPNGTTLTVFQVMAAANANFNPTTGLFYGGDQALTSDLNNVLDGINSKGDISS